MAPVRLNHRSRHTLRKTLLAAVLVTLWFALILVSHCQRGNPRLFIEAAWPESMGSYVFNLSKTMLPGIAATVAGGFVWFNRGRMSKSILAVTILALSLAVVALPLLQATEEPPMESAASRVQMAQAPHSGEERMQESGRFVRVSDPRHQPGEPVQPGWQQALWKSMTNAIAAGEEQVVMVISRQGCPWCDRLLPVLQKAIGERAVFVASDQAGDVGGLLAAPLRVFVYDAQEFGPIVEQFRVEGFPTLLFFGQRGVKPIMVPGYLDDKGFGQVLHDIAVAEPERPGGRKRGKLFGIFR